jgi:hypothetical protein
LLNLDALAVSPGIPISFLIFSDQASQEIAEVQIVPSDLADIFRWRPANKVSTPTKRLSNFLTIACGFSFLKMDPEA